MLAVGCVPQCEMPPLLDSGHGPCHAQSGAHPGRAAGDLRVRSVGHTKIISNLIKSDFRFVIESVHDHLLVVCVQETMEGHHDPPIGHRASLILPEESQVIFPALLESVEVILLPGEFAAFCTLHSLIKEGSRVATATSPISSTSTGITNGQNIDARHRWTFCRRV